MSRRPRLFSEVARPIATVTREVLYTHLTGNWRRSRLALYEDPVTIADPGHGLDEITPVSMHGQPFDVEQASHVQPFTPAQVLSQGSGTGYITFLFQSLDDPSTMIPGERPVDNWPVEILIEIVTPTGLGHLHDQYSSALAQIFSPSTTFTPNESGILFIKTRTVSPSAEELFFTGSTAHHQTEVSADVQYYGQPARSA